MYRKTVDPNRVLIWQHTNTTPQLENIARSGRLGQLPPTPVFELPDQYRHLGDYVLHDGHHRREAARRTNSDLPIIVLECAEDFKLVENYNLSSWYEKSPEEFERIKQIQIECGVIIATSDGNSSSQ